MNKIRIFYNLEIYIDIIIKIIKYKINDITLHNEYF